MGLLALPGLLLAPPGPPLDADVFDASALPTVTIDIVAPHDVAAVDLTAPMVQISGGSVQSVAKVEPSTVAISLVIDDGPTLTPEAVTESQGASVELVRNTGDGTQISLSTPSGLQTAPTVDRDANIARISGIVAGAPDVVALPNLLIDAATRLAAMPTPDRHLVLVIGTTFPETTAVQSLRDVIIPARIRLDVVAATGLDPGPIDDLAIESGGLSPVLPKPVGEMDAVTEAIRDRYHVTGTVDGPGTHNVTLNVDGRTFGAQVEVPDAPPPPAAAAASTTAVTPTTVAAASPTQTQTRTRTTVGTPRSVAAPTTSASSDDDGGSSGMSRGARIVVVLLALVAAAAFGTFVVLSQRAKAAAGLRRARAAARAAEGGEGGEDDGADVVSADAPSVWDRPPDLPSADPVLDTGAAPEPAGDGPATIGVAATAATATAAGGRSRRRRRRHEPHPVAAIEPTPAVAGALEPAPEAAEPFPETTDVPPVAVPAITWRRRWRHPEAETPTTAPEPTPEPLEPEIAEPDVVAVDEIDEVAADEPIGKEATSDGVPDDAVVATDPGSAPARTSARAKRRARKKARRQLGQPDTEVAHVLLAAAAPGAEVAVHEEAVGLQAAVETEVDAAEAETAEPEALPVPTPDPHVVAEPEPAVAHAPADAPPWPAVVDEIETAAADEPEGPADVPGDTAADVELEPAAATDIVDDPPPVVAAPSRQRGGSLNDRPRRVSSRRPVEPPVEPAVAARPDDVGEAPDDGSARRGRRRTGPADRSTPERTRRGSPADLPKRARTRRRFDNIPLIDAPPDDPTVIGEQDEDWLTSGHLRMRRSTGQVISNGREVSLSTPELGVLELLLRSGSEGVTPEAIKAAAGDDAGDPDAIVAQLRRKTGVRGRGQGVRKERVLLYFLGEDEVEEEPTGD